MGCQYCTIGNVVGQGRQAAWPNNLTKTYTIIFVLYLQKGKHYGYASFTTYLTQTSMGLILRVRPPSAAPSCPYSTYI